ncbi:hypothetical protein GBF38_007652, partial [Nibea albiflora]
MLTVPTLTFCGLLLKPVYPVGEEWEHVEVVEFPDHLVMPNGGAHKSMKRSVAKLPGRHTDPIIKMSKRRSDESLGRENKRSRRNGSPCEGCSEIFSGLSPSSTSSSLSSVYTDVPEMPEESLSRSNSEAELEVWLSATSDFDAHTVTSTEAGVTTSNIRKREETEEPRKRSREIQSSLEGPSHQDTSDKPRKRSRKTQGPSDGSSHQDCCSD